MNFLNSLNWVDVLLGVIITRVIYMGIKRGVVIESFKLIGVFLTVLITLHYFSGVSKFLQDKPHLPEGISNLSGYIFLWSLVIVIFKLICDGFTMLFQIEAHSAFDRWGGLILSTVRAFLLCSLTVVALHISHVEYFTNNAEKSFLGSRVVRLTPKIYEATFYGFISKFFPTEELNENAFPLSDAQNQKKKSKS